MSQIPVLDVSELTSKDPDSMARVDRSLRTAFGRFGILHVTGHGFDMARLERLYDSFVAFTQLSEIDKQELSRPDIWFQRGWTPPNTEKAVVAGGQPDYKECFFACGTETDPATVARFPELYAANLWPRHDDAFARHYEHVARSLQALGETILAACERALGLEPNVLVEGVRGGPHVTRLLNYLPLDEAALEKGVLWGENHTDFNCLTLLPGGRFIDRQGQRVELRDGSEDGSGLFLTTRPDAEHPHGERVSGSPPAGAIVAQVGQQLEILTGGTLLATPHEIRAPKSTELARLSCAHFTHMHPESVLFPLEPFRTPEAVQRYRPPVLAGTYDVKTLHDIGLAPREALDRFGYGNYERIVSQSESR